MVEYSLVMPVMEQYITKVQGYPDDIMYGYCMAVFSAARVLFMPVLGVWADSRPMIEPFTFSVVLSLLGNGMYALAEYGGSTWWIFFGRGTFETYLILVFILFKHWLVWVLLIPR